MLNSKEKLWLVFGEVDGWVVHTNYQEALNDYQSIVDDYEGARLLEVDSFKELKAED